MSVLRRYPLAVLLVFVPVAIAVRCVFTVFEVVAIGLSVVSISLISHDGETHGWRASSCSPCT